MMKLSSKNADEKHSKKCDAHKTTYQLLRMESKAGGGLKEAKESAKFSKKVYKILKTK